MQGLKVIGGLAPKEKGVLMRYMLVLFLVTLPKQQVYSGEVV